MPQVTGFSASEVPQMLMDLEALWPDARANERNPRFNADDAALRAIWQEQTAALDGPLTENNSCKPAKVVWLEAGDHTVVDETNVTSPKTTVTCNPDGPLGASNSIEYSIKDRLKVTLKVRDQDCGNYFTRDQKFQHLMMSKIIDLVNQMSAKVPVKLAAFAGVNLDPGLLGTYSGAGVSTAEKSLTRVSGGNFNAYDIVPYFEELADINRLNNPFVLDGGNLRYVRHVARAQAGTSAGDEGAENLFQEMRTYQDSRNFRKASMADSTFVVDRGATALFTAAYNPQNEDVEGDGFRYTQFRMPLLGLRQPTDLTNTKPLEADALYVKKKLPIAEGSAECELFHIWELKLWYLFLLNPLLSANDGVTGVLRIKRDNTLAQIGTPMQKALVVPV